MISENLSPLKRVLEGEGDDCPNPWEANQGVSPIKIGGNFGAAFWMLPPPQNLARNRKFWDKLQGRPIQILG